MNEGTEKEDEAKLDEFRKTLRWYMEEGYKFDEVSEDDRNYGKAFAFLERANEELKSAQATLKLKNYRDTIYHAQRIVEILGKSLLLTSGYGTEDEFKGKVGHNFFKYILKKLRKLFVSMDKYSDDSFISDTVKQIDTYFGSIDKKDVKKTTLEFNNYTELEETFDGFFKDIQYISELLENIDHYKLTKDGIDKTIHIILEEAEIQLKRELTNEEKQKVIKVYENGLKNAQSNQTGLNTFIIVLLFFYIAILSMNLDPHFESVRYPEDMEPIYTKDTELVKNLPTILRLISRIIKVYYTLIDMNLPP